MCENTYVATASTAVIAALAISIRRRSGQSYVRAGSKVDQPDCFVQIRTGQGLLLLVDVRTGTVKWVDIVAEFCAGPPAEEASEPSHTLYHMLSSTKNGKLIKASSTQVD